MSSGMKARKGKFSLITRKSFLLGSSFRVQNTLSREALHTTSLKSLAGQSTAAECWERWAFGVGD